MNDNTTVLSLRPNQNILALFSIAEKHQPLMSRSEILSNAIEYALAAPVEWKAFSESSSKNSYEPNQNGSHSPMFIQIRVNSQNWKTVTNQIKNAFNPPLKRTTTPYILRLVLENFVRYLQKLNKAAPDIVENSENPPSGYSTDDLEIIIKVAKIISLNRESDKPILDAIKIILEKWSE